MHSCTAPVSHPSRRSGRWLSVALAAVAGASLSGAALAETQSTVVTTTADIIDFNDNQISLREAVIYAQSAPGATITFDPSVAGQTFYLSQITGHAWGPTSIYTISTMTIDGGTAGVTIARDPMVPSLRLLEVYSNTLTLKSVTIKGARVQGYGPSGGGGAAAMGGAIANTGTLILQGVTFVDNEVIGGSFESTSFVGGSGLDGVGRAAFINGGQGGGQGGAGGLEGTGGNGSYRGGGGYGSGPNGVGGRGAFGSGGGMGDLTGGAGGLGGGGGGSGTSDAQGGVGGFGGGRGTLNSGGGGAGMGGAIFNAGGTIIGTNVTFSGNSALGGQANPAAPGVTAANNGGGYGGAIFNFNGNVTLTHVTLANNIAPQGGGAIFHIGDNGATLPSANIRQTSAAAPAVVTLTNVILAGSNDGAATPALVSDFAQTTSDTGNTGNAAVLSSSGVGNLIQTRAVAANDFGGTALTADPRLLPLANNGGSTLTFALGAGSPALNAGVLSVVTVDQRGQVRPQGPSGAPGLLGFYYNGVTQTDSTVLGPLSNLEARMPAALKITPTVDFGVGTETVAGNGSVLDREGSGGNIFGGVGVDVGVNQIAALWAGAITVPRTATYRFTTRSDDGSVLYIDGQIVVDNNFFQGMTNRSGDVALSAGPHAIKIGFVQGFGGLGVQASWQQLDGVAPFARQIIPVSVLSLPLHSAATGDFADIGAFEATDVDPPAGGSFAVLPGTAVKAGDPLAAVFAGWTDASPIQYEVSDGATVISPLGNAPTYFFTLSSGLHQISGRVVDGTGLVTPVGPVSVLVDGQAPLLTVPDDIFVVAHTEAEAMIHFAVTAVDDIDSNPVVTLSTPSGSLFPNGTTTVTVTATDAAGNVAEASFHVTVAQDYVGYRRLVSLDGLVPGAGEVGSGIEEETLFSAFGPPAINSAGDVVMLAKVHKGKVKYPIITLKRGAGSLPSASSTLPSGRQIARLGDVVPGTSDVVWASLKDPQIADDGSVLVLGTVKGATPATVVTPANKTVLVWYPGMEGAEPQLVARTGQTLAGVEGATLKTILGIGLVNHGNVALTGSLALGSGAPAVTGASDRVVLTWDAGSGELVSRLREGTSPGGGLPVVKNFKTLVAGPGAVGMGRGWFVCDEAPSEITETVVEPVTPVPAVRLRAAVAFADGTAADLSIELATGVPTVLFANGPSGTTLSDAPAVRLKALGLPAVGVSDEVAVVRAVPGTGALGLFVRDGSAATALVRAGDTAPQSGGAIFKSFGDAIISADGDGAAFLSRFNAGGSITMQNDSAIYWGRGPGIPLELVAREGDPAPGTGGGVFKTFSSLAAPGGGQGPLLLAKLAVGPGGVTSANDVGLWAMDGSGGVRLLLREGTTMIGSKTVKSFKTLAAASGSPGISRNFNGVGEVLAVVTFTDTTTAVVSITVPPPSPR